MTKIWIARFNSYWGKIESNLSQAVSEILHSCSSFIVYKSMEIQCKWVRCWIVLYLRQHETSWFLFIVFKVIWRLYARKNLAKRFIQWHLIFQEKYTPHVIFLLSEKSELLFCLSKCRKRPRTSIIRVSITSAFQQPKDRLNITESCRILKINFQTRDKLNFKDSRRIFRGKFINCSQKCRHIFWYKERWTQELVLHEFSWQNENRKNKEILIKHLN